MSDIGPGDWVEYIGRPAGYVSPGGPSIYEVGRLYLVLSVGHRLEDAGGNIWDGLRTPETPRLGFRGRPCSVPIAAFRPIYRPKQELIQSLLTRSTTKHPVDA